MQPPRRRTFLALGLLLAGGGALSACTGSHDDGGRGEPRRPDPDEPVRLRAVAATDTLLAGYDALLAGPGAGQAALLQPLRAEVVRHRAALAGGPGGDPGSASSASSPSSASSTPAPPSSSASAPSTGSAVTTPAGLASLERQTAQSRLADLGAASPQLARLLASVSAAGVLHAVALGDPVPASAPATVPAASPSEPPATAASDASAPPSGPPAGTAPATASPAGTGSAPAVDPEAVTALQGALGAEHAAVYGYGVVGARLPDDHQRTDARTALAAHQARRDSWQRLLGTVGATPSAAAAGYQLPFAVTDAAGAVRLAAHLETRLTAVYADLVAAVPGPQRAAAADALRECALRAHRWGAVPTPFPGLPDTATPTPTAAPTP
ncbi:DUF4439 domain-containing protein [Kitasatospora hibisci]|uniref:ferritin-like domain-containing protein n=1 Tax=Kitasatospora hibisci TaxID=3369522 RepID=UPI00375487B2